MDPASLGYGLMIPSMDQGAFLLDQPQSQQMVFIPDASMHLPQLQYGYLPPQHQMVLASQHRLVPSLGMKDGKEGEASEKQRLQQQQLRLQRLKQLQRRQEEMLLDHTATSDTLATSRPIAKADKEGGFEDALTVVKGEPLEHPLLLSLDDLKPCMSSPSPVLEQSPTCHTRSPPLVPSLHAHAPGSGTRAVPAPRATQKVKEERKRKRLLRNRVSAQMARERKRAYVQDLEQKAAELEEHNRHMEEKIDSLSKENDNLRQTMRRKVGGNAQPPCLLQPDDDAAEPSTPE